MQSQHALLFYDFKLLSKKCFNGTWHGTSGIITLGAKDPEATLQNVTNWSIMVDFQSLKYCKIHQDSVKPLLQVAIFQIIKFQVN